MIENNNKYPHLITQKKKKKKNNWSIEDTIWMNLQRIVMKGDASPKSVILHGPNHTTFLSDTVLQMESRQPGGGACGASGRWLGV